MGSSIFHNWQLIASHASALFEALVFGDMLIIAPPSEVAAFRPRAPCGTPFPAEDSPAESPRRHRDAHRGVCPVTMRPGSLASKICQQSPQIGIIKIFGSDQISEDWSVSMALPVPENGRALATWFFCSGSCSFEQTSP